MLTMEGMPCQRNAHGWAAAPVQAGQGLLWQLTPVEE